MQSEEKMRVLHDKNRKKLRHLDERGAEAQKVDSTRALVRSLLNNIGIAIQVVDKISVTISKIRDQELWPQLKELIKGYVVIKHVLLLLEFVSKYSSFGNYCSMCLLLI